jgi:hypothetical protein
MLVGALALVVLLSAPALACNDEGHMAVAYLAYQRLKPATRKRVAALLKLNPYYKIWQLAIPAGTSPSEANRMIFMFAATWPDEIKGDPAYQDDGTNGGNTPAGPDVSRNIGYEDHLRHKYWHFIDVPFSQDGTALHDAPSPNAQTQIAAFRAVLASRQSDDVKSYDLSWLEHLVGDIHQPLHAVARFSADLPNGDAGGNLIHLCSAPCNFNLHTFWDRLVGSQSSTEPPAPYPASGAPPVNLAAEAASATVAAKALPSPDDKLASQMDEAVWVKESVEDAEQHVYVSPIGPGAGPYMLTSEYFAASKALAEQRVALAGARLGNLLNRELK